MRPIERRAEPQRAQQQQRAQRNDRSAVLDALRRDDRRDDRRQVVRSLERRDDRRDVRSIERRYDDRRDRFVDWNRDRDRDRGRYVYVNDRDRYYVNYDRNRSNSGPAFCRSGAGHPVFGHRWCADRGYYHGRRDVRYVYVDDRDRYYINYDRDRYVYNRPRHQRPRQVVHYVYVDDRDRYYGRPYDPYYAGYDPYGYDPYYDDGYYAGHDPYGYDPYGYDPYYRRDDGSVLGAVLQAILFPQNYYVEEPTHYVLRLRYYVAPPPSLSFSPSSGLAVNAFAGSPSALSAYPSSYYPPTYSHSLVSLNFTI